MQKEIKGIVRPPMEMPAEYYGQRSKLANVKSHKVEVPLLITLFAWFCVLRATMFLVFALIVGIAPTSDAAVFVVTNFDHVPKSVPASPEAVFYIQTLLYGLLSWRWFRRDWRARWFAMFMSGYYSVRSLILLLALEAVGGKLEAFALLRNVLLISVVLNGLICAYLAFYPGMEQAFKETPWS